MKKSTKSIWVILGISLFIVFYFGCSFSYPNEETSIFDQQPQESSNVQFIKPNESYTEILSSQIDSEEKSEKLEKKRALEKSAFLQLIVRNENEGTNKIAEQDTPSTIEYIENDEAQDTLLSNNEESVESVVNDLQIGHWRVGNVDSVEQDPDTRILQQVIRIAEKMETYCYTSQSLEQLKKEIFIAKQHLTNPLLTHQLVEEQTFLLLTTIESLERKPDIELSKIALFYVIEEMKDLASENYPENSDQELSNTLKDIQQVYDDPEATIQEVRAAIKKGEAAIEKFVASSIDKKKGE